MRMLVDILKKYLFQNQLCSKIITVLIPKAIVNNCNNFLSLNNADIIQILL
jgi:hypothetical protein